MENLFDDARVYKVVFSRDIGNIFHYGHFIVDAVIPFLSIYSDLVMTTPASPHLELLIEDRDDQQMGPQLARFFQELFSTTVTYVYPAEFVRRDYPILHVKGLQFGPYPLNDLIWAETHMGWGGKEKPPRKKILIIERGFRPIDLPPHCRANRHDTGNRRRRLENQQQVVDCVRSFADRQCLDIDVVRLEEHDLQSQMRYFAEAWVVIGQHGAGLCNLLFSHRDHGHVLEISHWGLATIKNIARAKGWQHHIVKSTMRTCDTGDLLKILTKIIITG
jgi:hypothetical protein